MYLCGKSTESIMVQTWIQFKDVSPIYVVNLGKRSCLSRPSLHMPAFSFEKIRKACNYKRSMLYI